jgi:DNA-binding beta-propeller fold protein YncE
VCVGAVLGDALRRVSVLGSREGMPRSLGSVYAGTVARFLGGLRGVVSRVINTPGIVSSTGGVAMSRDGSTLLVSDHGGGSHAIHEFNTADGSLRRVVGGPGYEPLQFDGPRQVWVAPDGFVFVADYGNNRVQVLTPALDFHSFAGDGYLDSPRGVCANADIVVVAEELAHRISVFNRGDGRLLRRFGRVGGGDGELYLPTGLCFMSGDRRIAIADCLNRRVSVFSVEGGFVRHVGVGSLQDPVAVACSAVDEIVVVDTDTRRLVVYDAGGDMVKAVGDDQFTGVAIHGGAIFAQSYVERCVVFE